MRETDTIRAGEFRSRVTFKIPLKVLDANQNVESVETVTSQITLEDLERWEDRLITRCKRNYERGLEAREDRQDISVMYETLYVRYRPSGLPQAGDAAICDGKIYEVVGSPREINGRNKLVKVSVREVL